MTTALYVGMTTQEQTETLDKLRTMLQSIAVRAVEAQDKIGNPDFVFDCLSDIEFDMMKASRLNAKLLDTTK